MSASEIREKVRAFITKNFYVSEPGTLTDETSFLDSGIIDSTGVLEVVAFLEATFAITIGDEELIPQNLDTVGALVAFVEKKQAG